ncbi:MAG: transketolase [Leptospiraceae bacterium]|nr:transketolase [Leptospiraceae bacterium]
MDIQEFKKIANQIRILVIKMVTEAKSGHPGGPLGLADIFTALYFKILNHDFKNPSKKDRDRLILSNAHVCAVRYAAMALSGYFPIEELMTFRRIGSRLQGHPSTHFLEGLESCGGSLGQGLSVGTGLALGARLQNQNHKIYVCMSDGECGEGMTWEAAQSASHYKLDNIIAFMDRNSIQIDGYTENVMKLEPLADKFRAFGWNVIVADGHDFSEIDSAFEYAKNRKGSPNMIIFKTILGKGVSFMENNVEWHGTPTSDDQAHLAISELESIKIA